MENSGTTLAPGSVETSTPDSAALATLDDNPGGGSMGLRTGTTGDEQLTLPPSWMRITYGVGKQSLEGHPLASLALDLIDKIADKEEKLVIVITGVNKYWKEWLPAGSTEIPRRYHNEIAAKEDGHVTRWGPKGSNAPKPTVAPAKTLTMFIRQPEGCASEKFILALDGNMYAPVSFDVDKGLCKKVTPFLDRLQFLDAQQRKKPLHMGRHDRHFLTLHTYNQKIPSGRNMTFVMLATHMENNKPAEITPAFWADWEALMGAAEDAPESGPTGEPGEMAETTGVSAKAVEDAEIIETAAEMTEEENI